MTIQRSVRVAVTGAAGQIGYALVFRIAAGEMFGPTTEVHLHLLELPEALQALQGVEMELEDCAFPLLRSVVATDDASKAFKDIDWALLVGSVPRKAGMERGELLAVNGKVFIAQGRALDAFAKPSCRVLVVGNPCNTNAFIAQSQCKKIPPENFFAMTMLDETRAKAQLAQKAGVAISAVKRMAIWGNHSATQYPDFANALINGKPAPQVIGDDAWLATTFIETVQKRGAQILAARGKSSAASAANALIETVKRLTTPTARDDFFSVALCSDGSYGIPEGLMFSFPVQSDGTKASIASQVPLTTFAKDKIRLTTQELLEERQKVEGLL